MHFLVAQHPAQFQEPKKRNENTKSDDAAGEKVINAYIVKRSGNMFTQHKSSDHFLNDVKGKHQQAKQNRLVNS